MQIPPLHINILITDELHIQGDIRNDLVIEETCINKHMEEIAGHIAYWGSMVAEANKQLSLAKIDYDTWIAQMKKEASNSKELKSEKAKEEAVMLNNVDQYGKKAKDIIDLEYNVEILKSMLDAFKAKKDTLISLSANYRSEFEREFALKQYNAKFNNNGNGSDSKK
jgi:uncharacterized lipoprotein YehR (DUF1307 family)